MKPRLRLMTMMLVALVTTIATAYTATAQAVRVETAIPQVYERLPNFPLENQYRNIQGNKPDPNNTIVNRLVRYHLYIKGRPVSLRLDWKHTIADYLEANETIDPSTYPTQERLSENPLEADRAVISKLSRSDREQLIQTLVTVFTPPRSNQPTRSDKPIPGTAPNPTEQPLPPRTAPQPGGAADLLK